MLTHWQPVEGPELVQVWGRRRLARVLKTARLPVLALWPMLQPEAETSAREVALLAPLRQQVLARELQP